MLKSWHRMLIFIMVRLCSWQRLVSYNGVVRCPASDYGLGRSEHNKNNSSFGGSSESRNERSEFGGGGERNESEGFGSSRREHESSGNNNFGGSFEYGNSGSGHQKEGFTDNMIDGVPKVANDKW